MTSSFVLDNSVSMAWLFSDQGGVYVETVMESFLEKEAIVPGVWPLEVANILSRAERHKIIQKADSARFVALLDSLPIQVIQESSQRIFANILDLSRTHGLTSYDASYLDLAMRQGIPLATLDKKLRKAAHQAGVILFAADQESPPL
ncbi:MAG: type II toxin-antitoxin system VapC family toxin [Magnetococcales bacterium]|nr:type II toxin-antitoxin system VapC family toxin [Magnetococcales bacterium]